MQSKIRHRKGAAKWNDVDEDTPDFLLNRSVTIKHDVEVEKEYRIYEFLGSGKFGDVNRCEEKATGYTLAAKVIPVSSLDEKEAVMNEVEIMSKLRHARLIQLYDVFVQQFKITLIMELITGGELFERVIDESFELDEATCEKFMREILQGVEYIHSQHVLHLDLKPENILCLSRTGFKIKIIDFGLAREVTEGEMRVMFGTPEFVAPEIISYDPVTYATDMWSVGVICYVLLSGLSPFMGDNESETLSNIVRCNYTFDYPEFKDISADAKDFIRKLLHKNPSKRNSATQCLSHPWLRERPRLKRTATVNKKRLRHFVYRRKWQKAVNAIIALQRMGVVLTHTSDKESDLRKLLQAKSTKTAALLRRSSIREGAPGIGLEIDRTRKRSFGAPKEPSKPSLDPRRSIAVAELPKITPANTKQRPQIMVTNPSEADVKKPEGVRERAKSPTPNQIPLKSPQILPQSPNGVQSVNNPKMHSPPTNAMNPAQPEPKAPPQRNSNKPAPSSNPPKPEVTNAVQKQNVQSLPGRNQNQVPEKSPTSSSQKPNAEVKASPSLAPPKSLLSSERPMTAPAKTTTAANSNSPFQPSSGSPSGRPNLRTPESVVMQMVKLSKPQGSVADRINFFNNSSEKQLKSAKNKKFSLYS